MIKLIIPLKIKPDLKLSGEKDWQVVIKELSNRKH